MNPLKFNLDITEDSYETCDLMQGYDHNMSFIMTDNYTNLDLTGVTIQVQMQKADSKFIIQTEKIKVVGNVINVEIDKDLTRENGKAKLQIVLVKNNKTFGSWVIKCKIKESAINDNDGQSENKVTITEALTNKITEANVAKVELDKSIINGDTKKMRVDIDKNSAQMADIVYVSSTNTEQEINNKIKSLVNGGSVIFKNGEYNDTYNLDIPNVDLIGQGAIIKGNIKVGSLTQYTKFNSSIRGFKFTSTVNHITIFNTQRFCINNNVFLNGDKSILIKAEGKDDHANEVISIENNTFQDMNYCLYIEKKVTGTNLNTAEINFSNNPVTKARITTIHCEDGVDGLTVNNNLFYMFPFRDIAQRQIKKHHIYVGGTSNFVNIIGNQFFESGEESIKLVNPLSFKINDNQFGWCCQKELFSVIKLSAPLIGIGYGTINGNSFNKFSKHCVEVETPLSVKLTCNGNVVDYDKNNLSYYGTTNIDSIIHYILYLPTSSLSHNTAFTGNSISSTNSDNIGYLNVNNVETSCLATGIYTSSSALNNVLVNVTNSGDFKIASICNSQRRTQIFAGMLIINSSSSRFVDGTIASYSYMCSKTSSDALGFLTKISSSGKVDGLTSRQPSFTFKLKEDGLYCTPINNISGNFFFNIIGIGDVSFY